MSRARIASLHLALFLSGMAALAYETAWGRMLHRVFGVGDLAVATVLAAFFLGLGAGSLLGGRIASRLVRPAIAYAALEVGIGVWAIASLFLVTGVHSVYAGIGADASFGVLTAVRLGLALVVLLPPTLFMGATLPVLVKAVSRAGGEWSSRATSLYVTNTLGATAGAALTGLVALPTLGNRLTLIVAACASVAGALLVLAMFRGRAALVEAPPASEQKGDEGTEPGEGAAAEARAPVPSRVLLASALAGLAGFAALASEVLWTRVLRIVVHGTTPAFAAMLSTYLAGIALGSLLADRIGRSARPLRLLGDLQLLLALLTTLSMFVASQLPRILGLVRGEAALDPHHVWIVLVLALLLLFPIALALGTAIPLAWRIAGGPPESAASNAGRVLAANTLGGLAGSLAAGFVLVPALGIDVSLVTVAAIHVLTSLVALSANAATLRARLLAVFVPVGVAVAIYGVRPSVEVPFLLHARNDAVRAIVSGPSNPHWREQLVFFREGRNTTVTVTDEDGLLRLYNDGRPESGFGGDPPGFGAELSVLGTLPTLFAGKHGRAMVVGLGAAHTTAVLLGGPWERVDVVELEEAVVEAARVLYERQEKPFPLDDERTHLIVDDARTRLLLAEPGSYDAIVSQPSHPWLAGSSALYTREFFEEAERALAPGGVIALWVNLFRTRVENLRSVVATLTSVFPHGHAFVVEDSSFILVASASPIPFGRTTFERARLAGLEPFLEPHGLDHGIDYASVRELDPRAFARYGDGARMLSDDSAWFEFELAQTSADVDISYLDLDRAALELPWISPEAYGALPAADRAETIVARIHEVSDRLPGLLRVETSLDALGIAPAERAWIDGAIAEERGDVRGALARYDASTLSAAAFAADELRYAERMHRQLVAIASTRATTPSSARPFLSSAIALDSRMAIARALEVAEAADDPGDGPLVDVARSYLERGCEGLLASEALAAEGHRDEHVAFRAMECAARSGESALAARFTEERTRIRRALALETGQRGRDAHASGNGGAALRYFRRSLAANPAHGPSAAGLAKILDAMGEREEATRVLTDAMAAAEGLPQSASAIRAAATSLMIDLGAPSGATFGDGEEAE